MNLTIYFDQFGQSVDKFRNQVISTYGRHVVWASNSEDKVFALYRIYHFWRQIFPNVFFYPDDFFWTFLWDTVYFRSLSTRSLPVEIEIDAVLCFMRQTFFGTNHFVDTSLRQIRDLTNTSLCQMCHLVIVSQECLVFSLNLIFQKLKP